MVLIKGCLSASATFVRVSFVQLFTDLVNGLNGYITVSMFPWSNESESEERKINPAKGKSCIGKSLSI